MVDVLVVVGMVAILVEVHAVGGRTIAFAFVDGAVVVMPVGLA